VPLGSKEAYQAADYWKEFKEIIEIEGTKGDVNNDMLVDVEDVVGIVNKILGEPADNFNEANADVTGDGKIDVDDVVAVVNIILDTNE
jgi:DNA polymerase II small subunit/DNA polymerase delta subunit B